MNPEIRYWSSAISMEDKVTFAMNLDVGALARAEDDHFSFDALMIHAWLSQLLDEAIEVYVSRKNSKFFGMQSGQAQRGFLRIFGHPQDEEFHRLLQSMSRFTTCEDPLAVILFRALDAVSAEHDAQGDFIGVRAIDGAQRPVEAAR